jgi:AraC-like DNA-binding protein
MGVANLSLRRCPFLLVTSSVSQSFSSLSRPFNSSRSLHLLSQTFTAMVPDVLGRETQNLWERLAASATFSERVQVIEKYLLPFAANARARTSIMKSAHHIFHRKGAARIDTLAFHTSLSVRQYERRFAEEMGLSPKLFARITRFQMAFDAKRAAPARSWLSVAHKFGYFDQMHMIRDFQDLGGDAPGQILRQSGDLQPWSICQGRKTRPVGRSKSRPVDSLEGTGNAGSVASGA